MRKDFFESVMCIPSCSKYEDMMQEFIDKLDGVQASVNDTIESLDEKKKEEAKTSIEVLKKNLDEIKVEVEK